IGFWIRCSTECSFFHEGHCHTVNAEAITFMNFKTASIFETAAVRLPHEIFHSPPSVSQHAWGCSASTGLCREAHRWLHLAFPYGFNSHPHSSVGALLVSFALAHCSK
ncbi:unnamed protein product, partial [Phaeothamnion confervicola]